MPLKLLKKYLDVIAACQSCGNESRQSILKKAACPFCKSSRLKPREDRL